MDGRYEEREIFIFPEIGRCLRTEKTRNCKSFMHFRRQRGGFPSVPGTEFKVSCVFTSDRYRDIGRFLVVRVEIFQNTILDGKMRMDMGMIGVTGSGQSHSQIDQDERQRPDLFRAWTQAYIST